MLSKNSGIYKILNKANGKFYIGSALNFYVRWSLHKSNLKGNKHKNKYLQSAWNKYGEQVFEFIILEETENLKEREQHYIDALRPFDRAVGYNLRRVADTNLGLRWSTETRTKQSLSHQGKKLSEETKRRMSIARMGHVISQETRDKIRLSNTGKIRSDEIKIKMSLDRKGIRTKPDRWPCPDGWYCTCNNCINKKKLENSIRNKKRYLK